MDDFKLNRSDVLPDLLRLDNSIIAHMEQIF